MEKNNYNVFIETEKGFHLKLIDTNDERNEHPLLGFMILNTGGDPDCQCSAIPVIAWHGSADRFDILHDDEVLF